MSGICLIVDTGEFREASRTKSEADSWGTTNEERQMQMQERTQIQMDRGGKRGRDDKGQHSVKQAIQEKQCGAKAMLSEGNAAAAQIQFQQG